MAAHDLIVAAETYGLTSGRLVATSAALLGLFGSVVGGVALSRSRRGGTGTWRRWSVVAVAAGVIATAVGVPALAVADGGPGTGNGVVGAWAAIVLGPIAAAIGGVIMARARLTQSR